MSTNRELLESLRDGFANLKYGDEETLATLLSRGEMILGKIYGESSKPYEKLTSAEFQLLVSGVEYSYETWKVDQRETTVMFETLIEEMDLEAAQQEQSQELHGASLSKTTSNRVFVVHGRDDEMKHAVARTVERLGLEAVILNEQPNQGQTIIEKIERYSDVGFAVVLLSPDDTGYSNADGSEAASPRARQNVILELGYFAGKLGRENVVALHRGNVELPSDYDGVLYTRYGSDSGAWRGELVTELRESGYAVSADSL